VRVDRPHLPERFGGFGGRPRSLGRPPFQEASARRRQEEEAAAVEELDELPEELEELVEESLLPDSEPLEEDPFDELLELEPLLDPLDERLSVR